MDNRKKIIESMGLGVLLITAVFVAPAFAKKPLYGEMTLSFNPNWFMFGPQTNVPDWVGTVEIDGETYGMLFFAFGSGKPFLTDPPGKVHFFEEVWAIYETSDFPTLPDEVPPEGEWPTLMPIVEQDWADWLESADVVMWGYDQGVTNKANSKYHMTGNVEEAFGEYAEWEGRQVYMSGIIQWAGPGMPESAPGVFRIN